MIQDPSALPVITSWGQAGILLIGAGIGVKWILPLFRNGNGNGAGEWRGKVEQLLVSNSELLQEVARATREMQIIVAEIERRGRNQEEAIRKVLHTP